MKHSYKSNKKLSATAPDDLIPILEAVSSCLLAASNDLQAFKDDKPLSLNELGNIYIFFDDHIKDKKVDLCLKQIGQINQWIKIAESDQSYNENRQISNLPSMQNLKKSIENQCITSSTFTPSKKS